MRQKIRKGILGFSILLFPLVFLFLSPFIIVVASSHGVVNGSAMMFGLLFLFSLMGSRLFCGWLCPGGAIQDGAAKSNTRLWNGKWKNAFKYMIWAVWFLFIIILWVLHAPLKANFFYMANIELTIVIIYFIVVTIIYGFAMATGIRGMCHSLCWMAPFMVIGEKVADVLHIPRFRLRANSDDCVSCGKCNKHCPMSLDVRDMVKHETMDVTECIGCLECVDICPKNAISCGISQRKKGDPSKR